MDRATQMAEEIARQQAACQVEIDASQEAMRTFITGSLDGDIEPYLERMLVARMRMEMTPWLVEEDFRFLYGDSTGKRPIGLLSAQ